MRFGLILAAALLVGCTMTGGKGADKPDRPNPILGDAIATTSLDAPEVRANPASAQPPATQTPATDAAKTPALDGTSDTAATVGASADPAKPAELKLDTPPKSAAEAKCLRSGGTWANAGKSSGKTCVYQTQDAGKSCSRQSQCEGLCLARSATCAPIRPMFGCNEIFQADGRKVTLCID